MILGSNADSIVREFLLLRSNPSSAVRESKAKRRRRLLVEFLDERSVRRRRAVAEQETSFKETEVQNGVMDSPDLLSMILMLLPAESLFRLQFVCKMWFDLINASAFARRHAQRAETGLVFRRLFWLERDGKKRSYFHFLDLDRRGNDFVASGEAELSIIRASYDGLVLGTLSEQGRRSLTLINPVTSKHISLPLGEINGRSFGIASCNQTYRVVVLFRERTGPTGCMVMHNISARKWKTIQGPPPDLSVDFEKLPVSVRGTLNWMPSRRGCDFLVAMEVDEERFVSRKLPAVGNSRSRLLEIGGDLGFGTCGQGNVLEVWILGGCGLKWMKKCSVDTGVYNFGSFPRIVCSKNGGGVVVETKNEVYEYRFETGEMEAIGTGSDDEVQIGRMDRMYVPHRNTLASWEDRLEGDGTLALSA